MCWRLLCRWPGAEKARPTAWRSIDVSIRAVAQKAPVAARAVRTGRLTETTMPKRLRGDFVGNWFLRIAVLYIIAGVGLGIYMGASGNHALFPLHAHLNLLGWVAMSLFGLFYRVIPAAAESTLGKVHFWIYVPANFAQMVLLAVVLRGNAALEPALGLFSTLVGAAFICFAVLVWRHTGKAA
jgi:hypothetical protein